MGHQALMDLAQSVGEALLVLDPSHRIVMFNQHAEQMFGVSAHSVMRGGIERFIPPAHRARHQELVRSFTHASGGTRRMARFRRVTGLRADGSTFPMRVLLGRMDMPDGAWTTALMQDISVELAAQDLKEHNARLEAQARSREVYLTRVSHELRTPLNAVLGFSNLLLQAGAQLSASEVTALQHIRVAGEHMLALVNDLLDLSHIDGGHLLLDCRPVDALTLAEEAVALLKPQAQQRGIRVSIAAITGSSWVRGDVTRLRQVLVNLLGNGIKYTQPGGRVELLWREHADRLQILVRDSGCGLSAEQQSHLFEPFNRLGQESSGIEGTGLGLVLSRSLVTAMGGTLTLESALGQGTTVTLELATAPSQIEAAKGPADPAAPRARGITTLLYVEDDPVNVQIVQALLALKCPQVQLSVATSGSDALRQLDQAWPEMLLTDMNLGDMTGLDLLRAIRAREAVAPGMPVYVLSADASRPHIEAAIKAGVSGYLTKPLVFDELLRLLAPGDTP